MKTDSGPEQVVKAPPATRRLYRDPSNRIVAGVAAGLAEHLGLRTIYVRVGFILLLAANGLGALLYAAFWAVLPTQSGAGPRRRVPILQRAALLALGIGVLVFRFQLGGFGNDVSLIALLALVAFGAGTIWHQADPGRRRRNVAGSSGSIAPAGSVGSAGTVGSTGSAGSVGSAGVAGSTAETPVLLETAAAAEPVEPLGDRRWFAFRMIGGGLLVVIGIVGILGFLAPSGPNNLPATLTGLLFGLLALTGLVLALAPLFYRVFGQLREERIARIREQERAEVAAVVHDQVLHTLALIQRNAGDTTSVVRLARGQERTLRNWLYKPAGSPTERFSAALEQAAAEVEDTYGISVETVVVGDAATDERVGALVAATREALVNAARHAKVGTVSLYAEAEEEKLSVFVRDRGSGFDLSSVDDDRHGVRGSIIARMRRHGGQAEIRSTPGEGTEVALTLPHNGKDSS